MEMLIIQESGAPDRAFDLFGEDVLIGRSRSCDLRLANVSVSREHARLRWDEGDYTVEDAGSHNGVYVNGERTEKHLLKAGDRIRVGKYAIVYLRGDLPHRFRHLEPESIPRWLSITIATAVDETFQLSSVQMRRMVMSRRLLEGAKLVVADDPAQRWALGEAIWTMGRNAQIPVNGLFMSAKCVTIKWNGCNHAIQRAGGWAKLRVNGQVVTGHVLAAGDDIEIGDGHFRYVLTD
jgi:hypothetical protein